MNAYGTLMDYETAEPIRAATRDERRNSIVAAKKDGGAGVIVVDTPGRPDRRCYVEGETP